MLNLETVYKSYRRTAVHGMVFSVLVYHERCLTEHGPVVGVSTAQKFIVYSPPLEKSMKEMSSVRSLLRQSMSICAPYVQKVI